MTDDERRELSQEERIARVLRRRPRDTQVPPFAAVEARFARRAPLPLVLSTAVVAVVLALLVGSGLGERRGTPGAPETPTPATGTASAVPSPEPTATPSAEKERVLPTAIPTPDRVPVALAAVPEAGGIIFAASGIWRYEGDSGTVEQIGTTGHLSADGRGYVVRTEDGPYRYVDAATGAERVIAPPDASDADAVPANAKGVTGVFVRDGQLFGLSRDGQASVLMNGPNIVSVRADPTGRFVVVIVSVGPQAGSQLRIYQLSTGQERVVASLPALVNDLGDRSSAFSLASWSPDGRFLAYFGISISNSVNADGVDLSVVDVTTAARTDLGKTLFGASRLDWAAPHTLAYVVTESGRMTWERQILRTWSPEAGVSNVTGTGDVGLNPSWSADGSTLYFINARSATYEPLAFFAGRDSGARRIASYVIRSRTLDHLSAPAKYVHEGVRPSSDGARLLVLRRTVQVASSLEALPPIELELALLDLRTQREDALVRIANDVGFGYYGGYGGPEGMAWSQ